MLVLLVFYFLYCVRQNQSVFRLTNYFASRTSEMPTPDAYIVQFCAHFPPFSPHFPRAGCARKWSFWGQNGVGGGGGGGGPCTGILHPRARGHARVWGRKHRKIHCLEDFPPPPPPATRPFPRGKTTHPPEYLCAGAPPPKPWGILGGGWGGAWCAELSNRRCARRGLSCASVSGGAD